MNEQSMSDILNNPKLAGNLRGQLAHILRSLNIDLQKTLSLDFAEHIVWICEEASQGNPVFRDTITTIRHYLEGIVGIEVIDGIKAPLMVARHELYHARGSNGVIAGSAALPIQLALNVCCQRLLEAEAAKKSKFSKPSRYLPDVMSVAYHASLAVAQYTAGTDWCADDQVVRNVARKRGYETSDLETRWQIKQVLDAVGSLD